RCRFLMFFRTTSTGSPCTSMMCLVITLMLCQLEGLFDQCIFCIPVGGRHGTANRAYDEPLFYDVVAPAVFSHVADCSIDALREILVATKVVVERLQSGRVDAGWVCVVALGLPHLPD